MLLYLGLIEVLLLECLLLEPPFEFVLARGVLTLSLVSTRVVVLLVRLLLALHIGVVSNEVVRVTTVEATLFAPHHATSSCGYYETT